LLNYDPKQANADEKQSGYLIFNPITTMPKANQLRPQAITNAS
jgi:hypothetical protein